jgi:hypothetical protein
MRHGAPLPSARFLCRLPAVFSAAMESERAVSDAGSGENPLQSQPFRQREAARFRLARFLPEASLGRNVAD